VRQQINPVSGQIQTTTKPMQVSTQVPLDTGQVPTPPTRKKDVSLKIIAGFIIALLIGAGILAYYFFNLIPARTLKPSKPVTYWNQIVPGQTKEDEVVQKLGTPASKEEKNKDYQLLSFVSDSQTSDHCITVQKRNHKVVSVFYVVAKNENKNLNQFLDQYGQPGKTMYSSYMDGVKTFVWPKLGLAVWADENTGRIFFIRYFVSMELGEFIDLYGNGLFENSPYAY